MNYGGHVVAGVGFFLTRFTVTLAFYDEPLQFYLGGVVPLALDLGLAAFGMALAVGDVEASLAWTTARWCLIGAGTMLLLVVLTVLGAGWGLVLWVVQQGSSHRYGCVCSAFRSRFRTSRPCSW